MLPREVLCSARAAANESVREDLIVWKCRVFTSVRPIAEVILEI